MQINNTLSNNLQITFRETSESISNKNITWLHNDRPSIINTESLNIE